MAENTKDRAWLDENTKDFATIIRDIRVALLIAFDELTDIEYSPNQALIDEAITILTEASVSFIHLTGGPKGKNNGK